MKKTLILILIASMLMVGCNKNIDNDIVESVADINEASEIVAETTIPKSTVTETSEVATDKKPQFEHDWQTLYYDELTKYVDPSPTMFNICDLDGDGTPELLLSGGSHHGAVGTLFTAHQGKLVFLGGYGSWGEFQYDFERNYIHSGFFNMGTGYFTFFSFKNGEIAEIVSFYVYTGGLPPKLEEEYKINDEEVSEDIFNAEYEKYSFDIREDFIVRKYDVNQSVIESVLMEY